MVKLWHFSVFLLCLMAKSFVSYVYILSENYNAVWFKKSDKWTKHANKFLARCGIGFWKYDQILAKLCLTLVETYYLRFVEFCLVLEICWLTFILSFGISIFLKLFYNLFSSTFVSRLPFLKCSDELFESRFSEC